MRTNPDHIHAQLGTAEDLLSDTRFMSLIEMAEVFNGGSPFTLCHCTALGKDDINLTGSVRQRLEQGHWIPDAGLARLVARSPANGRSFALDMILHTQQGHISDIHLRFDESYFTADTRDATLAFIKSLAEVLDVAYGYVHHARDEAIQDATDPNQYRALTGLTPPTDPIDTSHNPGRSTKWGELLVTCRWLSIYGGSLYDAIGRDDLESAPCTVETIGTKRKSLQLYDDPFTYDRPENRDVQARVREHLGVDLLANGGKRKIVAPPATSSDAATPDDPQPRVEEAQHDVQSEVESTDLPSTELWWARIALVGSPAAGEDEFFAAQASRAAGRVLEVGCGTGSVTLAVARTGVPLVAVDRSARVIDHLKAIVGREADSLQSRTKLLLADILQLDLQAHGPFAAALIPHRGINRFVGQGQVRTLLNRLHSSLQPGGILAFDTFFPVPEAWSTANGQTPVFLRRNPNGHQGAPEVVATDAYDVDRVEQILTTTRRLDELDADGRVVEQHYHQFDVRYFYPRELRYLLELCGFECQFFGGYNGSALITPDQDVVVIATRK